MADDFESKSAALMSWLATSGASLSSKIALQDLRSQNSGRGVVAVADIAQDEALFSIPRNTVLSVQNSPFSQNHKDMLDELEADPWLQLILVMMFEYGKDVGSPWKPYFDVLPAEFETLMYWSEEELADLEGSAVVGKIGKANANSNFKEHIVPVIMRNPGLFGFHTAVSEDEVLQRAHRMASTIMAYGFDIEPEAKEADDDGYATEDEADDWPKGMVPLADMLNADGESKNNAQLFYEQDALVMKALRAIPAEEEIFNTYGLLPRSDLLRRYGYITENYSEYDVVEISHEHVVSVAREDFGVSQDIIDQRTCFCEEEFDAVDVGYDISRPPTGSDANALSCILPELSIVVLCYCLSPTTFSSFPKPRKALLKIVENGDFPVEWFKLMQAVVKRRLDHYGAKLQDDVALLQSLEQHGDRRSRRKRQALQVRIGEKEILAQVLPLLMQEETNLQKSSRKRRPEDIDNGIPAKKLR